ncbi:MAG: UDP-glucose 4-epimerase GalE [Mucilaginibacter sp.]|uniref:UDP-glucose 4-epimerase GalE n=1 Tax=Mucilaginibacter sp. L3T2-6 TaxID=3062491 RepID=UPI00267502CB|nr:UDP-glucose 4-epimerase GalE [Mucilaginibacter sp. L3T2-6]MDO3644586.1 UDP-glucose 4-epimerase GalE [Mucilaginibacter sp. L3T2-6]MDV6217042.1 UDP-glucose 4-epimerase GalE [Mucilaginibacter sp. L3T2-6]
MAKILVTGGLGYIGSHTVVELVAAGYEPVIVDDLSNSNIKILDQLSKIIGFKPAFHQFDLCDMEKLEKFVAAEPGIEGIIHFAAFKAVGESVKNPLKYYHTNIASLVNLLKVYKDKPADFVFSSSCTVYGQPDILPVTEDAPVKPAQSPYGNTKQIAEEILKDAVVSGDVKKVIALRYFNPVGAHESALIGELPNGVPQNLVPFITQTAIGKREKITVFGNDYNTKDGSCIRDYIHVVDLAKAHVAALKLMANNDFKGYDVFNLGTGNGNTVLEIIAAFENTTGVKLNYEIGPRREGDVEKVWGDVTKSANVLKWTAKLGIDVMMASAWEWEKYLSQNPS